MIPPGRDTLRSLSLAKRLRQPWEGKWQRLFDLAMPYRTSFWGQRNHGMPAYPIYDSAGVVGVEEMASRLQSGIVPAGQQWAVLQPWKGAHPDLAAGLQQVQDEMFAQIDRSNFHAEVNDCWKDLCGPGQGCLRLTGGDWMSPLQAMAIPLPNVWVTPGADGKWADIHVVYRLPRYAIEAQWPDAALPPDDQLFAGEGARDEQAEIEVYDSWIRDLSSPVEKWRQELHACGKHLMLTADHSGQGACPYIFGRWSKSAGDLYAVGQGMLALPDLETLNEMQRLILAHGEMALSGMWQADDDGVLNPHAVQLEPGAIIPIASGSKGLQPLAMPGARLDLGNMQIEERRHAIRKALFNEQLGARTGTPPTAFEIQERQAELARQIGPAFFRVWHEFVVPIIVRVRRLLIDAGIIVMPLLDGKKLQVVSASAIVRAAAVGDMQRIKAMLGDVGTFFGPQAVQTAFDLDRFLEVAAEKYGVPRGLAYTRAEMQANAERTGAMLGKAAGSLGGPEALAPLLGALGGKGGGMPGAAAQGGGRSEP